MSRAAPASGLPYPIASMIDNPDELPEWMS